MYLTLCRPCESLRHLRETIPLRTALVKIRAHSWLKKNTSRYAQIRGDFLCLPWILCENYCTQTPQNNADALRNFAPLRERCSV